MIKSGGSISIWGNGDSISKRKRSISTKLSGHELYTMLAAGFLAGESRQEKASVRLPCSGKKLAANVPNV